MSFPLNKNLWTSSFVLVAAGYSLTVLTLAYWVMDVWGWGRGQSKGLVYPWLVLGANSITALMPKPIAPRVRTPANNSGLRNDRAASDLTIPDRKRLEVAKALALDPDVLLLDEVMAGLNATEVEEALELLRDVNARGVTLIVVEHLMKAIVSMAPSTAPGGLADQSISLAERIPKCTFTICSQRLAIGTGPVRPELVLDKFADGFNDLGFRLFRNLDFVAFIVDGLALFRRHQFAP